MSMQKSAEGVVAAAHGSESLNMEGRRGAETSMDEGDAQRKAEMPEDSRKAVPTNRDKDTARERQPSAAAEENAQPEGTRLLEEVLRRENLMSALRRVQSNKGAPGVDGMTVEALTPHLKTNWPRIREELLSGSYIPDTEAAGEGNRGGQRRPSGVGRILSFPQQQ